MAHLNLSSRYHDRFDPATYDRYYSDFPEAEWERCAPVSPFDVWSLTKLRNKHGDASFERVPTDLLVWGHGEPKNPAATKIGGLPAWPAGKPLPSAISHLPGKQGSLRFFGQLNFIDSLDLLPALPGGLLSLWITEDFPYEDDTIHSFWLNPEETVATARNPDEPVVDGIPAAVFHAQLYRTWDPMPGQKIEPVAVDHQFESYRTYVPYPVDGSKFGGLEEMPQWGSGRDHATFLAQFASIQATSDVPYPWVNREEPYDLAFGTSGIHHSENCLVLGDMGAISFHLGPEGNVTTHFECG